jgi:mRNA interferase RelE/StbE
LAWRIEFAESAVKQLRKLDPLIARRITGFLRERVAPARNPRALGRPLKGAEFGEFFKYRVGDYRLIVQINDRQVRILVVRVGHRREIYR